MSWSLCGAGLRPRTRVDGTASAFLLPSSNSRTARGEGFRFVVGGEGGPDGAGTAEIGTSGFAEGRFASAGLGMGGFPTDAFTAEGFMDVDFRIGGCTVEDAAEDLIAVCDGTGGFMTDEARGDIDAETGAGMVFGCDGGIFVRETEIRCDSLRSNPFGISATGACSPTPG